jgi:cell division protein ZipA
MQELRWILLGLGVVFLLGLWIWEARRPRQANPKAEGRPSARFEPTIAGLDSNRARQSATAAPEESDEIVAVDRERSRPGPAAAERVGTEPSAEPVIEQVMSALDEPAADVALADRTPSIAPWPKEQKIITLRVSAPPLERFEGQALVDALRAERLVHGRYEIFHRTAEDGAALFSVASLVEPGTFDLAQVAGKRFPGVTIFAVLPGPLSPMATFDSMLDTARSLADRLRGLVQDERGANLSAQRLMSIREGLIEYQHRLERQAAAGQH